MVGPSLIQHLARGEVSRHEMPSSMIAEEARHSAAVQRYPSFKILAERQSSDLRRSADL